MSIPRPKESYGSRRNLLCPVHQRRQGRFNKQMGFSAELSHSTHNIPKMILFQLFLYVWAGNLWMSRILLNGQHACIVDVAEQKIMALSQKTIFPCC